MRACFDACVIIYATEGHGAFGQNAIRSLAASREAYASDLAWLECRVMPLRDGDEELLEEYRGLFETRVRTVPVSREILDRAAELRAAIPGLRTPDAIHAATALALGVPLVTADPGFRRVHGLDVRLLGAT